MIGTIYANSVSDSERTGKSAVHRSFRNLGRSVDGDGDSADLASGVSPRGMQYRTSASSPSNQRSLASRSAVVKVVWHSSGSCSPADTSTRAKNLTPFSRRERRIGENRSPATEEQQQHQQVVNEHNRSQHHHHHLSSSSDRLYATASADEEVFLARVRQSASPSQKLSDDASHQSGVGPSRIRIRSKESLSSGAHGCDHRTGVESPLNPERVHSDSDRGAGGVGPRVESSSFTGSVRLTLKQRSEDLTDDGGGPQKIRTLSTRTNSSTDEFPGVIRAQSKAISYESICLKIKEEAAEKNPKTIQVISLSQPPKFVSSSKAVLLGESVTNNSPKDSRNPPCSASQVCDVQFPDAGISSRPVQRDHSIKHRSNVFFSSKKSVSGSHTDLSQVETARLLPVHMSKVSSLPAKLIKRNAGGVNLKSDLGQPSKISDLHDNNTPGKVIKLNIKSHDVNLHTSSQTITKSEDRQKATIIVNAGHVATSDKRLSKMGSTEQPPPSHFELSPNRLGKESKFFLRCDQQPRTTDQLIMGTVFTDRHTPRQNLLFPGTDFTPRDNSNSGRTSDTKASQNSKSVPQVSAYKIIKQNSRPFVEESKVSVVPENKGGDVNLVREAPISTQVAPIFSKDSGGRIKIIKPVATSSNDNNKFSSSFLCSLSKFSQPPADSISICTSRQKPLSVSSSSSSSSSLSRVGWAKQRLGQDPENKSAVTNVSQLKTSLKDSATTGTQKSGSAHQQQMHNADATVISTFKQDRVNSVDGKHTIVFARRGLPSAGEIQLSSSAGGEPLQLPVTTQEVVTVSPSPLVLGPAKLTTSSTLLPGLQFTASKKLSQASVPLVSERQNPATTGSLPTGSFKVFIQNPHQAAALKRSSLLVPHLSTPLSDAENSLSCISQDSVNSKDIGLIELEVLCHGEAGSADSLRELDSDSTGLMDATSSSPVGAEDTVVRAFVRKPQLAHDCALVQQILPTVIVEPCLPGDNQVFVYPIENVVCQEEHLLLDTTTPDGISQSTQAGASLSKHSLQSDPSFTGKAYKSGVQVTQDSLQEICFSNERSVGETSDESRDPLKIEKPPADPMTRTFNPDNLLKASTTNENSESKREVSTNDEVHELALSDTHSPDSRIQERGPGLCSKVSEALHIDAAVHGINDQLSQLDRNPESFEPSSASEITNRTMVASGNDDYHVEITSKSATGASKTQGLTSQRRPTMDIVSEMEISTTRGLAMTEDKREGSTGIDGSLVVSTKDTVVENVLSEDKRVERTEHSVKPEVRVVRGGLARTRSIPSLEIIEENSTSSTTTTTLSSSTNPTSPTKVTTSSRPIISAKEAHNIERASHDDHVSNYTGDAGNLVQTFAKKTVHDETLVDSVRSPLLKTAKTDSSMVGSKKKTVEKEKARRVVRFVSQDEMLEYSPTEFRDSSTPSDLPAKKHCSPFSATESDALSASMEPAAKRFPDAPFIGDSPLKSPRKDPETFEDFLLKSPKNDSETFEDFLLKSSKKDSETLEDFLLKSPKKDSETFEDFLLKSPRKDPETSKDDASKTSPSAGKTTTTTTTKPCIVRKQLIHLDSALHPSSCVPPDSTPVEARWSPKLVRKLNLAEAKDVDVSDLDVAPDLMDFLSKEMEKVSVDMKQPDHGETKDELETGTQGIPSISRQRKPPLSLPLPLKSSEREDEEDARPSSASAVDIDPVKTEPEVGKRKFFSALKANAASFRAKKVLPSVDDPSPDPKSNLDRLASFAIISDVGIGAKRRQFQRHKEAASLSSISSSGIITDVPSTDAHAKQLTLESPPSATDRIPTKQASIPASAASGADDDKTKTRLVIDEESETRFGTAKGEAKARLGSAKARLGKPEVDSDDDFDRLVEINIRELVDETESRRDGPESMEQRTGAKNQTGTGIAGTSGTAGTVGGQQKGQGGRRQLSRFKTQPVTNVEVEKAREMALHPKTNSEN